MNFDILYQDASIVAINKPAWWVVHRGLARDAEVVVDALKQQLDTDQVFPLHRLDRQTSGVLLFATSATIARQMQQQFETRQLHKTYVALVRGICPLSGTIDSPVPKNEDGPRVPAQTVYERIAAKEIDPRAVSLVRANPLSGRFHQIRRHLKHINHPIIGDANYGKGKLNRAFKESWGLTRMALHAQSVTLTHPETSLPLTIDAPLPDDLHAPLGQMGFSLKEIFNSFCK